MTLTKDSVFSLRGGRITLDGNDLSAEADVNFSGKPNVVASISAGALGAAYMPIASRFLTGGSRLAEYGRSRSIWRRVSGVTSAPEGMRVT